MRIYIKGMGNISPQKSWGEERMLIQRVDYRGVKLECVEPEYNDWLGSRQLKNMSRILRMSITAAYMALKKAKVNTPDAIITGTGYGNLEDMRTFTARIIQNQEQQLPATTFLNAGYHTVGSYLAMILQCQGYNQVFSQRAFSFEEVLLDAMMYLEENPSQNVLLGGFDEITPDSHTILSRFGIFRKKLASTLNLFRHQKKGTINGEGAAFFVGTGTRDKNTEVSIESVKTFYRCDEGKIRDGIEICIREAGLTPAQIDFILLGKSGNKPQDARLESLCKLIFPSSPTGVYKHLCGEHPTASAFAVWLAAGILAEQQIPEMVSAVSVVKPLKNILVINNSFGTHHSLILLRSCRDTI